MVTYSCPRCNFNTNHKSKMRAHFNRKNICSPISSDKKISECFIEVLGEKKRPCLKMTPNDPQLTPKMSENDPQVTPIDPQMTPIDPQLTPKMSEKAIIENKHQCMYCKRILSKNSHLHRHMRTCKEKHSYSKEEVSDIVAERDNLIIELKKQIEVLLTKVGNTTNIQQNIYINAFGNENTEYIKGDYVKNLLKGVKGFDFIPNLLKNIHFNPEHQENWNVCIPNKKNSLAKVYNGDKWIYQKKKNTIENMTDKAYKTIINNYDENENKSWKKIVDDGLYYDDEQTKEIIEKNTEIMILNSQDGYNKII